MKVEIEGVIQVKGALYSRALEGKAARHVSDLKEASGAGAVEGLGPNRTRQEPWALWQRRAPGPSWYPGHACVTLGKDLSSSGLSFLISKVNDPFSSKINILGFFLPFPFLVSKSQ